MNIPELVAHAVPLTADDPIRIDIDCFCSGVKELPDSVGHLPVGDLAPDLAVVI